MKILQLCVFTNLWKGQHQVKSIDLKHGSDIFDVTEEDAKQYDLIAAAPPCDQFTKANAQRWQENPAHYIKIAEHCLKLCKQSKKYWFIENPPGRIEKFIPELTKYRVLTWRDNLTNKEYIIYSNFLIEHTNKMRYGRKSIKRNKTEREKWTPQLITDIETTLTKE